MAEGELPTSYSQTRVMNAPPAVSTVSLVSTTTIVQLPPTATATLSGGRFRLTSATPLEAWCFLQGGQDGLRRRCRHTVSVCTEQLEPVAHSTVPCVLHAPRRHSNSLIAWAACCLLEETPIKTRGGSGGRGRRWGGGDANKPGECD